MTSPVRFLIGRHPMDLLCIAMNSLERSEKPPVICMTEGPGMAALALGHDTAAKYPGLTGAVAGDPTQFVRRVVCRDRLADVIFPATAQFDTPSRAELIDRVRSRFSPGIPLYVLIGISRIPTDLPPLEDDDRIECYWEVRDPMDQDAIRSFQALRDQLERATPTFHGIKLYARSQASLADRENVVQAITDACGASSEEPLLILDETPLQPLPGADPAPLEIIGLLARRIIHELANDLTCVMGNVNVATKSLNNPGSLRELLDDIERATLKAFGLIDSLRETRENLLPVAPYLPVEAVSNALRASLVSKGVWQIEQEFTLSGSVTCDLRWLSFAVRALLTEGHSGGQIKLRTGRHTLDLPELEADVSEPGMPVLSINGPTAASPMPWMSESAVEYIRSAGGWVSSDEAATHIYLPVTVAL